MRHFLLPLPVPPLPLGMRAPTVPARLVPAPRLSHAPAPRRLTTRPTAVAMPAIAVAAQQEELPAAGQGTGDEAQRVHRTPRAPAVFWPSPRGCATSRSPRARQRTPAPRPEGLSSGVWGALRLSWLARLWLVLLHSQPTSFQSPPRTPPRRTRAARRARPCSTTGPWPRRRRSTRPHSRRSRFTRISKTTHTTSSTSVRLRRNNSQRASVPVCELTRTRAQSYSRGPLLPAPADQRVQSCSFTCESTWPAVTCLKPLQT